MESQLELDWGIELGWTMITEVLVGVQKTALKPGQQQQPPRQIFLFKTKSWMHCKSTGLPYFQLRFIHITYIDQKSIGWLSIQCVPVCHLVLGDSWSNVWPTWTSESGWLGGVLQFVDFQRKIMEWFEFLLLIEEILWNIFGCFRAVIRIIHVQTTQK